MKKSICQNRNMISYCANEIEMKGLMQKWEIKSKMPLAKHGLVHENEIRPNIVSLRGKKTFWFWESLRHQCLLGMKPNLI